MSQSGINLFEEELSPFRRRLLEHPLFNRIQTVEEMGIFMESHVFAVWDFMSLLKTLQRQMTCVTVPWRPPQNREAARFINEIVTGEESDEIAPGKYISHFELYLEAMREDGIPSAQIEVFMKALSESGDYEEALRVAEASAHVCAFVRSTMNFCKLAPHEVAAAFLYGREDIIPEMFTRILGVAGLSESRFQKLRLYLKRHIEIDGDSHGPMAKMLMQSLCENDPEKWSEAMSVARSALQARYELWNGVLVGLIG